LAERIRDASNEHAQPWPAAGQLSSNSVLVASLAEVDATLRTRKVAAPQVPLVLESSGLSDWRGSSSGIATAGSTSDLAIINAFISARTVMRRSKFEV
jgi:hypothetical protein